MSLFKVIDWLLIGTRYGYWGMGILGTAVSLILMIVNGGMGIGAIVLFMGALLGSIATTLFLAPKNLFDKFLANKLRYTLAVGCLATAIVMVGIVYAMNSGWPTINLLFI